MGRFLTICFILLLLSTLSAQNPEKSSTERPDWMKHSQKNYLKIEGGHWFFGLAEGQVEEDVRTASFKNAQQQVSFHLGTQVRAMHKDYREKDGEVLVDASIQTGSDIIIHSYGVEYFTEKVNKGGKTIYRTYSRLQLDDEQYNALKLLSQARVELAVKGEKNDPSVEKLLKKTAVSAGWNLDPVVVLIKDEKDMENVFSSKKTAYIAMMVPEILSVDFKEEKGVTIEGGFSLEFYDIISAKQPKLWETDIIKITAATPEIAQKEFTEEAFSRLKTAMKFGAEVYRKKKTENYSDLSNFDPGLIKAYESAERTDIEALLFPYKAITAWQEVLKFSVEGKKDPRIDLARERVEKLTEYIAKKEDLKTQLPVDVKKINDLLGLKMETVIDNISVARDFLRKYGLEYGASILGSVINDSKIDKNKKKDIANAVYDKAWLERLRLSCEKKNPESCYFYGYGLELAGEKVESYEKYYEKACIGDIAPACYNSAVLMLRECSKGKDLPLKNAEKACLLGFSQGCFKVGSVHNSGKCSADIDKKKALIYFDKACQAGYYGGCAFAGAIYQDKKDRKKAWEYYKKACDMGYYKACKALK